MAEEVKQEEKSIIEQAKEAHEKLNQSIVEYKKLIEEESRVKSMELLGGKSTAGQEQVKIPIETPQEYAKRIMAGKR